MKKPILKYLGVAFVAAVLSLGFYNGAHASDANPMEDECIAALPDLLGPPWIATMQGAPLATVETLVRSDPDMTPLGRGLVLRALPALGLKPPPTPQQFLAFGAALCALEPVGVDIPAKGHRSEFDMRKPQDI